MTPQKQFIKGYDPEAGVFGDCHRTCFAVLLDMEPEEVPHFMHGHVEGDHDNGQDVDRRIAEWLSGFGLRAASFSYDSDALSLKELMAWMAEMNPGVPFILGGTSPRGVGHSVVCLDGTVACDPVTGEACEPSEAVVGPMPGGYWWITTLVVGPDWKKEK